MASQVYKSLNNYIEHQLPCTERAWTLCDKKQTKGDSDEKVMAARQCPVCYYVHPPAPVCPNCSTVYMVNSRTIDEVDGTLSEIDKSAFRPKTEEEKLQMQEAVNKMIDNAVKKGVPEWKAVQWATKKYTQNLIKGAW